MSKEQDDFFGTIDVFLKGQREKPLIETSFGPMELPDYVKFSLMQSLVPGIPTMPERILVSHILSRFPKEKADFISQKRAKKGDYCEDLIRIARGIELQDLYNFSKKRKELSLNMLADEAVLTPKELDKWNFQVRYWDILEHATQYFVNSDHLNA